MSEWEPATDAERAMRDALRTDDQESYFRILAGVDLLLPVSADALAGLAPLGWGTWSTGGRTHVLAFTSPSALQACLADYTGSARRVAYAELADTWPNLEWWLAVNPGLPIEGYLPAWFVAQLSRGDLRLPTRGPGREAGKGIQDPQAVQAAAMAANAAAAGDVGGPLPPTEPGQPGYAGAGQSGGYGGAGQSGGYGGAGQTGGYGGAGQTGGYGGAGQTGGYGGAGQTGGYGGAGQTGYGAAADQTGSGGGAPAGYGAATGQTGYGGDGPAGYGTAASAAPASGAPASAYPGDSGAAGGRPGDAAAGTAPVSGMPSGAASAGGMPTSGAPGGAEDARGPVGPGGLPIRTPGAVLPSGLPSRVPADPNAGGRPGVAVPAAYQPPTIPPTSGAPGRPLPTRTPMAQPDADQVAPRSGGPAGTPTPDASPAAAGGPLPRRQPAPPSERPPSMAAAAQAMAAGNRAPEGQSSSPPVIPGAAGSDRPGPSPLVPAAATRPEMPPGTSGPAGSDTGRASVGTQTEDADAGYGSAARGGATAVSRGDLDRAMSEPAAASGRGSAAVSEGGGPATGYGPPPRTGSTAVSRSDLDSVLAKGSSESATSSAPTSGPPSPGTASGGSAADEDDFEPANAVERDLLNAAGEGSTDAFLSTLLLATVLVPVADSSRPGSAPGESGFAFRTEEIDGERFLVVFTSRDRLAEHYREPARTVGVKFLELIRNWPDPAWSFAVNPGSPVGAKYPGSQVIALASWADEAGLGTDREEREDRPAPVPQPVSDTAQHATVMQKTVPPEQVDYYLERGYDRVAGFVHRANEVEHLRTPAELYSALGLVHDGSPFTADAKETYVLRWPAYRPSLYRIPYGGQSEQALRAMDGWVIERPPFRGNGFAPGEGRDVIAEFKVDSVRLPHGAQLWRIDADGNEKMVAIFDSDAPVWRKVGDQ